MQKNVDSSMKKSDQARFGSKERRQQHRTTDNHNRRIQPI